MNEELKQELEEMDKEQLISYINLMLDTIMTLEDRLQGIYGYVDSMSFASVIDNPKKDLYRLLRGEENEKYNNNKNNRK